MNLARMAALGAPDRWNYFPIFQVLFNVYWERMYARDRIKKVKAKKGSEAKKSCQHGLRDFCFASSFD